MSKLVVDAEAAFAIRELVRLFPCASLNEPPVRQLVRALTPIAEGGEAVPVDGHVELTKTGQEYAADARASFLRAAFFDPRAVKAVALQLLGEYGDHDEGLRETARELLAAACEAVLRKEGGE